MSGGAGGVRAGGVFVEIFAKDGQFQQAMTRVQNRLKATAATMRSIGNNMTLGGAAMAAPLLAAVNGARRFQDALLDAKTSASLTAAEMDLVRQKSIELSKAGVGGPGEIAEAFTALVKAGMPVQAALDGAAEAVVKFASNAGLDTTRAADIASDAMKVFGESTTNATDILKAAADSSSTDINQMTQAFSQSSAVAGQAGQSLATLSAALALMASQGVKGSDAGTSLKTMIQRLTTGADTAAEALGEIGLGVGSFRDTAGNMLPLAQVMDILNAKLGTLDKISRDNIMARIFGTDAIRAANILTSAGSAGFAAMADQMGKSMTNADAFDERMSGITGAIRRLNAALERMSDSVAGGLSGVISSVEQGLTAFLNIVSGLAQRFPILSQAVAGAAGFLLAFGLATKVASFALSGLVTAFSLLKALPALFNPVTLAIVGVGTAIVGGIAIARTLSPAFKQETDAIWQAIMQLDFATAWQIMNLNFAIALTQMAAKASSILGTIQGFFSATGSFIGDKLTEGLDRFMGLFGADVITLQNAWERLGIYFRAAFDWKFAATGMKAAIKEADAAAERARAKSPTADSRAADRKKAREDAAEGRQAGMDAAAKGWEATADELRKDLERAKGKLDAKPDEKAAAPTAVVVPVDRGVMPVTPQAAAEAAGAAGIGQTVGTFSSTAEGLGIGPELNKLEQPAVQTAANTAATAEAVTALAKGLDGRPIDLAAAAAPTAVGTSAGAAALSQTAAAVSTAAPPGGVAAEVAAPRAPAVADAARTGTATADWSGVAKAMETGFAKVVDAIAAHTKLTAAGNSTLSSIDKKLSAAGAAFV